MNSTKHLFTWGHVNGAFPIFYMVHLLSKITPKSVQNASFSFQKVQTTLSLDENLIKMCIKSQNKFYCYFVHLLKYK